MHDPLADVAEVQQEYKISLLESVDGRYDGVVLAVGHTVFQQLDWGLLKGEQTIVYDVKGFLDRSLTDGRL